MRSRWRVPVGLGFRVRARRKELSVLGALSWFCFRDCPGFVFRLHQFPSPRSCMLQEVGHQLWAAVTLARSSGCAAALPNQHESKPVLSPAASQCS